MDVLLDRPHFRLRTAVFAVRPGFHPYRQCPVQDRIRTQSETKIKLKGKGIVFPEESSHPMQSVA